MTTLSPPPVASQSQADAELVRAHLSGEPGAFDELYRRFHPRLVAYLTHRVGDRHAAEDLAQETLVRAMQALDRFDTTRPLWPWLRRIASNASIDAARANARARALQEALAAQPQPVVEAPDLAETHVMRDALAEVPDRQRDALTRCYVEGWRPVDAAVSFGVNPNAFEQLLHRARGSLRRAYVRHDQGERVGGWALLLGLLDPTARLLGRLRRTAGGVPRLAEAMLATVGVAAVVAFSATPAPAPRVVSDVPAAVDVDAPPLPPDRVQVGQDRGVGDAAEVTADEAVVNQRPGAGRPAPAAVTATDDGPADPLVPGGPIPGPAEPRIDPPVQRLPQSAPELVGGCGSAVREALCAAAAEVPEAGS